MPRQTSGDKSTKTAKPATSRAVAKKTAAKAKRRCGLCGKAGKLTRTECWGQWICDDEANYVLFSYARTSCSRNHRRFTLCGYHSGEGHEGKWQDCPKCRDDIETELYVYYGTNEYNFEKLANPPSFEPTKCDKCGKVINLGTDGYSMRGAKKFCSRCSGL